MYSPVTKNIVVLGSMRSGSTVLRQMIGSADHSVDLGEVFNDDVTKGTSFWRHVSKMSVGRPRFLHPHHWNEAWRDFIDLQSKLYNSQILCVDVKISCIDIIYRPFADRARFFFDSTEVHYILLRRNDLLAQAISLHYAIITDRWAIVDDDPLRGVASRFYKTAGVQPVPRPVQKPNIVNPDFILDTMRSIRDQYALLKNALLNVEFVEIIYEDMFDERGIFTEDTVEIVSSLSGLHPSSYDRIPALKKQRGSDVLSDVANALELLEAIRSSELSYTLDGI